MASPARVQENLTLEQFLRLPEEEPALEYIDGRIEAKVSPQFKHSMISTRLAEHLNVFARPASHGVAAVELRCTFAGRSIVPDVVYLLEDHILLDARGCLKDEIHQPPDLHVEVMSPGQTFKRSREKLSHSTANGCLLGWLTHPDQEGIEVFRPGQGPERLPGDGVLSGDPVLAGYRLPVAELFGWLYPRRIGKGNVSPSEGGDPA